MVVPYRVPVPYLPSTLSTRKRFSNSTSVTIPISTSVTIPVRGTDSASPNSREPREGADLTEPDAVGAVARERIVEHLSVVQEDLFTMEEDAFKEDA